MKTISIPKAKVIFSLLLIFPSITLAQNVEVALNDKLDGNLSGYCLDIVGGGSNINPADGLQAHTCYSYKGELGSDQTVDSDEIESGVFHFIEFDVCMTPTEMESGSKISLEECNDSPAQQFVFSENGQISPKNASHLCLTVGFETRLGRNGTSPHQIKDLNLQACLEEEFAQYQQWLTRTEAD